MKLLPTITAIQADTRNRKYLVENWWPHKVAEVDKVKTMYNKMLAQETASRQATNGQANGS